MVHYDKIIIGAGLYGLYAALRCGKKSERVLVLEHDDSAFKRATYINQARIHMGYHYPRSYSTAIKSAKYFERFCKDYNFSILNDFDKIYATSAAFSWSNALQFKKFCVDSGISCREEVAEKYFQQDLCDGAFLTKEYTYDAQLLKDFFMGEISKIPTITIKYNARIERIIKKDSLYCIQIQDESYSSPFVLNATYASINQIHEKAGFKPFDIKYEICEIILCKVSPELENLGITVMDGPFFSIMPFGKTGLHSLTSVTFTPHITSYDELPAFRCQKGNELYCNPTQLGNCNDCKNKPDTAWAFMSQLARKYLLPELSFEYKQSLFSIKPILKASEIDDSRPTVIKQFSENPTFISVLSGKINTIYDLDDIL
jgi:hypothetical protein